MINPIINSHGIILVYYQKVPKKLHYDALIRVYILFDK